MVPRHLLLIGFLLVLSSTVSSAEERPARADATPCALPSVGCCDGTVVQRCVRGEATQVDCAPNPAPYDVCGWSEVLERFECGGLDPVPEGLAEACP